MKKNKILLAEDELNVANFIKMELEFDGYEVDHAINGEEALQLFEQNTYCIALLDWMMPIYDGMFVCKKIRKKSDIPIIILTARDYLGDKIAGLDAGADDYITKPFEIEELLARMRAVLRRKEMSTDNIVTIDNLTLDFKKHVVLRGENKIELTAKEFELLSYFISKKNEVLSREEILTEVWGYDYIGQTNVVDVYVLYLRNKLTSEGQKKLIHTIRGIGYVLRDDEE